MSDYNRAFLAGDDISQWEQHNDVAMKYNAVFACCRVLAETFSTLPVIEYKSKSDGTRETTKDTMIYDIFHNSPNEEMSPFNYKEACMMALNLGGNSVSQKLINKKGDTVGLIPWTHDRVKICRNKETNKLEYEIVIAGKQPKIYGRNEVFHIPGLSFDGIVGLSPIEYASKSISLGLCYEKFGMNFYKNGANASGAFKTPETLEEESFIRLKEDLKVNYTGLKNTGTPMILEGGLEFQPFTINPADAQLIENKKFQIEDIARIYRVPLHLIQNLDRATFSNIEHQSLEFVMYTILPIVKRWEENINSQLMSVSERKAGYTINFKIDGLLRGDMKSRSEAYAVGRQWGWLSVNDIRKLENMNPIENGDIYLTPLNMVEAGTVQQGNIKALAEEIYNMLEKKAA